MSKLAGQMIASQLAAEHSRQEELPKQIEALRDTLTKGRDNKRIVILIDELDRCHPDYAIALLEAMKLVFGRPGFVFCLMVNADHLEGIARHRFGSLADGERYLDKFLDLRLKLKSSDEAVRDAAKLLSLKLPLETPFGPGKEFSVEAAAELAGNLAFSSKLTMRQIKRVTEKVEIALRCYHGSAIDCPLLVYLAFQEAIDPETWRNAGKSGLLSRAQLSKGRAESLLSDLDNYEQSRTAEAKCQQFVREKCRELLGLPDDRYGIGRAANGGEHVDWYKVVAGLGRRYITEHQAMLDAVHRLMAPE
jgi:hypothetical protein